MRAFRAVTDSYFDLKGDHDNDDYIEQSFNNLQEEINRMEFIQRIITHVNDLSEKGITFA